MASRYLTYNEAADRLCVSIRTVRRYVADGRLAARKLSRKTVLIPYPFLTPRMERFKVPERQAEK